MEIPRAYTDQQNLDLAESMNGSLAVTALSTIITEQRHLLLLPLEGVTPTLENLAQGRYPLSKRLYLVMPQRPKPLAEAFILFIRGRMAAGSWPARALCRRLVEANEEANKCAFHSDGTSDFKNCHGFFNRCCDVGGFFTARSLSADQF